GFGVWAGRLADERDELRADLSIVGGRGTTVRELRGTSALPDASARAFFAAGSGRGVLLAEGLPPIGSERVYALWSVDAGGAHAIGVFRPDGGGRGRLELLELEPVSGAVLLVTEEPATGSARPTGKRLLSSR
ncbi:MAG TPA: anti-sigma factor, partial [Gemmatimonadota bacterium]|nr:anti-sigma factor [Gemmatimonadota bacterium]